MTNVRLLLVVWLCTLVPAAARADDGGWYEWLQKMSGPTLMGFGSDIHLVCIDKDARAFNCEKFWVGRRNVDFDRIRHQIDFRFTVFTNVDDSVRAPRSIWALKLMGMYHYRITPQFDIAAAVQKPSVRARRTSVIAWSRPAGRRAAFDLEKRRRR